VPAWTYTDEQSNDPHGTPIISEDGSLIFVNSQAGGGNYTPPNRNRLLAINTDDGSLNWNYDFGSVSGISTPALAENGIIFFQTGYGDGQLYAINALSGAKLWSFNTGGNRKWWGTWPSPTVDIDGTVYIPGENNQNFYAINPDGTLKWQDTGLGTNAWSVPAIDDSGNIYAYARGGYLKSYSRGGVLNWNSAQTASGSYASHGPAILPNGTIFAPHDDTYFMVLNPTDGTVAWSYSTNRIQQNPAIDSNGNFYIANRTDPRYLHKIDSNGNMIWRVDMSGYLQFENDPVL